MFHNSWKECFRTRHTSVAFTLRCIRGRHMKAYAKEAAEAAVCRCSSKSMFLKIW